MGQEARVLANYVEPIIYPVYVFKCMEKKMGGESCKKLDPNLQGPLPSDPLPP